LKRGGVHETYGFWGRWVEESSNNNITTTTTQYNPTNGVWGG